MSVTDRIAEALGAANVLTGEDAAPWGRDWTGKWPGAPLCVARPASTEEVAAVMRIAHESGTPVTPVSGNTGVTGGSRAEGIVLSLDRMRAIREIRPAARTAVVEAGVVLSDLHAAVEEHDLVFPMTFGAKGSARIGGILSTNAGGSNVLRYGNTRVLCLGIEAVLADGRIMNLLSGLRKDNSGLDLRDLLIGAEGQLGIVTAAVFTLAPRPRAYATAMAAVPDMEAALGLLNRLQEETGGAVEACELMPRVYIERHMAHFPDASEPFEQPHEVNLLIELGSAAPRDATPLPDGTVPLVTLLEEVLAAGLEEERVLDAVVARSEAQRTAMWQRREVAAELTFDRSPVVDTDVAVPLDAIATFFEQARARIAELDAGATDFVVGHLGDGNLHYSVYPTRDDADLLERIREAVDDTAASLGGSFSAEHGVGLSKLSTMRRLKDQVALDVMRDIKAALDPKGILNPGKTIPPRC